MLRSRSTVAFGVALSLIAGLVSAAPISVRIDEHDFTFEVAQDAVYDYAGAGPDHLFVHNSSGHYVGQYTHTGVMPTVPATFGGVPPAGSVDPYLTSSIYDTATETCSTEHLSQARYGLAASTAGNEVFFARGSRGPITSNVVDIYTIPEPNTLYSVEKEAALYGNLDQHDIPGNGNMACGPTAAVNSFVYLQNKYPTIYGNALVPSTLVAATQTLQDPDYMDQGPNGVFHDDFIWGKEKYIEERVPALTVYQAQDQWGWNDPNRPKPGYVVRTSPTWDFIYNELRACEDVEALLSWTGGGHYVTLTGFRWYDGDVDGVIDPNEGYIKFVDPDTGQLAQRDMHQLSLGSPINVSDILGNEAWISMVVAESPVPEPATLSLLALAGLAVIRRRRK